MLKFKQQRSGRRTNVTRLVHRIDAEIEKEEPSLAILASSASELERQCTEILKLDQKILDLIEDTEIEAEIRNASDIQIVIQSAIGRAKSHSIVKIQPENPKLSASVKLPHIRLGKFGGDPLEFSVFWDLFRTSIHERTDLSSPAKFHYLISQLIGEAAALLSGFDHTEAAYNEAIDLLHTTYGRKKLLIQSRLNALFDLKSPNDTSSSLGAYRSAFEGHLRALQSLGSNITDSGYVFAELLLRKLPKKTKDNINRAHRKDSWDLPDLRKAISEEIEHMVAIEDSSIRGSRTLNNSNNPTIDNIDDTRTAAFPVTAKKYEIQCKYCLQTNHYSDSCTKYKTAKSRSDRVKERRLCYNCLRSNHSVYNCTNVARCRVCRRKHHTSLCERTAGAGRGGAPAHAPAAAPSPPPAPSGETQAQTPTQTQVGAKSNVNQTNAHTVHSNSNSSNNETSILPTAVLTIKSKDLSSECKSLFDIGSQKSFINSKIVDLHHLEIVTRTHLCVDGFGSVGSDKEYAVARIPIQCTNEIVNIDAVVVDNMPDRLSMPGRSMLIGELAKSKLTLADKSISDTYSDMSLIIGVDNYFKFINAPRITGNIYGIDSKVGTLIAGTIPNNLVQSAVVTILRIASTPDDHLDRNLERMWDLDHIGIKEPVPNNVAIDKFKESISFSDGRYTAKLPWKDDHPPLPSNKLIARKRLDSLLINLRKEPKKLQCYDSLIKEQLALDFIEKVPEENNNKDTCVHYIPHHSVKKASDTTPLRIVYDCSAKASRNSPSLNDCLLTGPSMVNDLAAVLLRFKINPFACTADIEKAYLMVKLAESDRDMCRFFWTENPNDKDGNIITFRFKVVLFGASSSQFLLNATIDHHLNRIGDKHSQTLSRNLYVDNVQASFSTENEMIEFQNRAMTIMKAAGFHLREWNTNSKKLNSILDEKNKSRNQKFANVLGLNWDKVSDKLSLRPNKIGPINKPVTKRKIVSEIAKTFDPFGSILPVTIRGKLLIQDLWKENLTWDNPVSDSFVERWESISNDINSLSDFAVDRAFKSDISNSELHVFADSSMRCYGSVAYMSDGTNTDFLIAKSRLAPINAPSLPQLELTALNVAARLAHFIIDAFAKEIKFTRIILWSDSEIAISWIKFNNSTKSYVKNRVNNIHKLLPDFVINHLPGSINPSDFLTRGISATAFNNLSLWLNGPSFLTAGNGWPEQNIHDKVQCDVAAVSAPVGPATSATADTDHCVIPVESYSSLYKAIRVTAIVLRAIPKLLNKFRGHVSRSDASGSSDGYLVPGLCVDELHFAEILLIKQCQRRHYKPIFDHIVKPIKNPPTIVRQLKLALCDGIIRTIGRLLNSDLPDNAKNPILLPPNDPFTKLLIVEYHNRGLHSGTNETLTSIRQKYWIPKGRNKIKSILRKCVHCLKVQGKPYARPITPPFPRERCRVAKPFETTGIDYTGFIHVTDGGQRAKVYIALFTCAVSRAIHLEVVKDNTELEFIRAFTRFVCRRSYPTVIYSDNASTFCCASQTLNKIATSPTVTNHLSSRKIIWKFITPRAAWHGGMWERMIGLTKNTLKKVIGNALLSLPELQTLIVQIEAKINDRPITHVSSDRNDPEPLTPSMLMLGFRLTDYPDHVAIENVVDPDYDNNIILTKRYQHVCLLLQRLWHRWQTEYLTMLRERYNFDHDQPSRIPQAGDVVLVHEDASRVLWRMGVISKLISGLDGVVRSAVVKTSNGQLTRAICKLYPLEVSRSESLETVTLDQPSVAQRDPTIPKRRAAIKAWTAIQSMI